MSQGVRMNRYGRMLGTSLLLIILCSCSKGPTERAQELIDGGLHKEANEFIREQLVKTPKDSQLQFLYGYTWLLLDRWDESLPWLERAVEFSRDDAERKELNRKAGDFCKIIILNFLDGAKDGKGTALIDDYTKWSIAAVKFRPDYQAEIVPKYKETAFHISKRLKVKEGSRSFYNFGRDNRKLVAALKQIGDEEAGKEMGMFHFEEGLATLKNDPEFSVESFKVSLELNKDLKSNIQEVVMHELDGLISKLPISLLHDRMHDTELRLMGKEPVRATKENEEWIVAFKKLGQLLTSELLSSDMEEGTRFQFIKGLVKALKNGNLINEGLTAISKTDTVEGKITRDLLRRDLKFPKTQFPRRNVLQLPDF